MQIQRDWDELPDDLQEALFAAVEGIDGAEPRVDWDGHGLDGCNTLMLSWQDPNTKARTRYVVRLWEVVR